MTMNPTATCSCWKNPATNGDRSGAHALTASPSAAVLTSLAPDGYSGQIRLLVAITVDGRILGVRVASHSETPGIGDVIEAGKSPWIGTFSGRSLDNPEESRWRLRRDGGDIDAISGATVSSRAVVAATRRAMQYFRLHRDEIFAAPSTSAADTPG